MAPPFIASQYQQRGNKFGTKLRSLRLDAGLSLATLAMGAKVSPTYLSLVERGKRRPPALRIVKLLERELEAPGALSDLSKRIPDDLLKALQRPEVQRSVRNHLIITYPWFYR
jgi:transcriptional regulator with XRE-family HTH domain